MALIKTKEQHDVELLRKVQQDIERRQRRERIHHILIAGLAMMTLAAFVGGHYTGRKTAKKRSIF